MKKLFIVFISVFIVFIAKSQTDLTEAVDFTATDIHGNEIHLFDILDNGQYVLIDFFYTTCAPCQQITKKIKAGYEAFGCNNHDVFFMEISCFDNDEACLNWCDNYGIEYPTISVPGGGSTICNMYHIIMYPTVILISPDKEILIQDLYPIFNVNNIIDALEPYGIEQHDCVGQINAPTNISILVEDGEEVGTKVANITWDSPYPNDNVNFNVYRNNEQIATNLTTTEFKDITLTDYIFNYESTNISLEYCIETVKDNTTSPKACESENLDLCVPPYGLAENVFFASKDGFVGFKWEYVYYTNLAEKLLIKRNDVVIDSVEIKDLSESIEYEYTDESEELILNQEYKYNVVAVYADGCEAKSDSLMVTISTGIDKLNTNNISIYPNPTSDIVNITGNNIQSVEVYNVLGQIIEVIDNIDVNNLTINTSNYNKGTYLLKITSDNNAIIQKIIKQ